MPQMEPLIATQHALEMLRQTKPWVRFISVLIWIGAAFMLLAGMVGLFAGVAMAGRGGAAQRQMLFLIVYLPVALLYIMPAIYLGRYASRINDVLRLRRSDVLEQALEAQKSFWKFCGMVVLVMMVFYVVAIVVFLLIGVQM
jgi:hypothetical protein